MTQPWHNSTLIPLQSAVIHPIWMSYGPGNVWITYGVYQEEMLRARFGMIRSNWSWGDPQLHLLWPVATFLLYNKKMKKIIDVWPTKGAWKAHLNKGNWDCRILLCHLSWTNTYHDLHFAPPFEIFRTAFSISCNRII